MNVGHHHRCPICWGKWHCLDNCTVDFGSLTYTQAECPGCSQDTKNEALRHEFDRFAAFIAAIRDLLRWLHVVEKLEKKAGLFFCLVQETATWCACPRDCDGVTHDDCECLACDAWVAISKQNETDRALAEEGELILEKGATQ